MKLTATEVDRIFADCLFEAGEDTTSRVFVRGIATSASFHPKRLQAHTKEILELLNELPANFHGHQGDGESFLQSCMDRNGDQWASEHIRMEELFLLGMAVGAVICTTPRELWFTKLGDMPFYRVNINPTSTT